MNKWLTLIALTGLLGCTEDQPAENDEQPGSEVLPSLSEIEAADGLKFQKVSNVGATCAADTDCKGTASRCINSVPLINTPLASGYCTATCARDNECGTGGGCPLAQIANLAKTFLPDAGALTGALSICLPKCKSNADCPKDLPCQDLPIPSIPFLLTAPNSKYCLPPLPQRVDGGIILPDGGFVPVSPDGGIRLPDGGTIPGLPAFPGGGAFPGAGGISGFPGLPGGN
ncbi:MAG: hypothetical protein ABW252_01560 [Polyangiales bacterium]